MEVYVICYLIICLGIPIFYHIDRCRKYRNQKEIEDIPEETTEETTNNLPDENPDESANDDPSSEESSSDKPLNDEPLDQSTTTTINLEYKGKIDVRRVLQSLVSEDKFRESSMDLDKILSEILSQQKKKV